MRPYQDFGQIGGRFNSEFGMESFPHLSTIDQFLTEDYEKHPQSATMDFHNKARDHEHRLATYIRNNFRATDSSLKVSSNLTRQHLAQWLLTWPSLPSELGISFTPGTIRGAALCLPRLAA